MGQHVFAVAVPVLETTEQTDQLGVKSADSDFESGLFAGAPDSFVDVSDGAVDALLDAGGLDPSVFDELGKCQFRDFPANRVETGQGDNAGGVINDDVNAGSGFQSPDITSFAADETAFHLIIGQGNNRCGAFRHDVGSEPVYGEGEDATGVFIRPGLVVLLQLVVAASQFVRSLLFATFEHDFTRLLGTQGCDAFEFLRMLVFQRIGFLQS